MLADWKIKPRWLRIARRKLIWQYRQATWRDRSLPDFIIIGAQKSGTSSLYTYLSQHPKILPSFAKEIHFFDGGLDADIDNFAKGQAWYRARFPLKTALRDNSKTFEASPLYIFNPLAPKRMFDLAPSAKIIALLRNPTERAISHYFHEKRLNNEPLPIREALEEEEKRLEPLIRENDFKSSTFIHHSYKSRGLYERQLKRYFKYFSQHQTLVLSSEELFRQPTKALQKIFEFVGVEQNFEVPDLQPRNVASNKVKVDENVYRYLDDYYRPHNQALYQLIGQNFGWET